MKIVTFLKNSLARNVSPARWNADDLEVRARLPSNKVSDLFNGLLFIE